MNNYVYDGHASMGVHYAVKTIVVECRHMTVSHFRFVSVHPCSHLGLF